ncbi:MAG: pyruvate kinase [Patescibacteria group bacterium]|nr:pyruvate kinase [Patescibacteria group bacterium]
MNFQPKRTKIVCTLGPASQKPSVIASLIKAGMNVARLNFSHGTYPEHQKLMDVVRSEAAKQHVPIAILQDLQGPKIRVGELLKEGITLKAGSTVVFSTRAKPGKGMIPVTYPKLHLDVRAGQKMLLADGLMDVRVVKVVGRDVHAEVVTGGLLTSHKGLNLPDTAISISAISDKDKKDMTFGVKAGVDMVALSFVRSAKEILDLRYLIKAEERRLGKKATSQPPIRIIAKIEKREAVDCIDEILEAADGIMVARGDLGIEMPAEDVPLIQKRLIEKALDAAKPVIVATQMLESMIQNPRPTRAEVSDVANAVIDHTDAVMLSAESAAGKYPVEAVETMARIVTRTEKSKFDDVGMPGMRSYATEEEAMSSVASMLARSTKAKFVLVASLSGTAGRIVSRFRPELPIFVSTNQERVYRQLAVSWGVEPFVMPTCETIEELIERSILYLKKNRFAKTGDSMIVIAGEPVGISGHINFVELRTL